MVVIGTEARGKEIGLSEDGSGFGEHEPRIEERDAQPYLAIAREVTSGVPDAVDEAFPALFRWLGERGIEPSGPPFIRTREVDPTGEPLELEVAVPVEEALSGDDVVHADALPPGRYLTLLHVGPYRSESERDLGDARNALVRWAEERGIVYSHETERGAELPCAVEHLRVGPPVESDYSKWETEFAYLIIDAARE
jgi:effector-binding domain-containing protein